MADPGPPRPHLIATIVPHQEACAVGLAAVLYEFGSPLAIEEIDVEDPRAGEVMVRMAASGV